MRAPLVPGFVLSTVVLFAGCPLLEEFAHMEAVVVKAHSPNSSLVDPGSLSSVRMEFSASMDRPSTENAFALSEDAQDLRGDFRWLDADSVLEFSPRKAWRAGRYYTLSLSTDAEDRYGNSLSDDFSFTFFTGDDQGQPRVAASDPVDGEADVAPMRVLTIDFSEPMDRASTYAAFALTPSVRGALTWEDDDRRLVFRPLEPFRDGQSYELRIETEARDREGNNLAAEFSIRFTVDAAAEIEVISVTIPAASDVLEDDGAVFLNPDLVEKDAEFLIEFSAAVPAERRDDAVDLSPSLPLLVSWEAGYTRCRVRPSEPMTWWTVYELTALGTAFRFRVSGPYSLPLTIRGVHYSGNPGSSSFVELSYGCTEILSDAPGAAFDVWVQHGAGATISLTSAMQGIDIDVRYAGLTIFILDLERNPIDSAVPSGPSDTVIRVHCAVRITSGAPGTVDFRVMDDLRDDRNNHLPADYLLSFTAR